MSNVEITALMQQAFAYHGQGQLVLAIQHYQSVLRYVPGNPDATYYLGVALLQAGQIKAARHLLESVEGERGGDSEFHFNLATACRLMSDKEAALEAFDKALELNPESVPALIESGTLLEGKGDLSEAENRLRKALVIDPKSTPARLELAIICRRLFLLEEAEEIITALLAENPDSIEAMVSLTKLRTEQGHLDEGLELLDGVLARAPTMISALMTKSSLLHQKAEDTEKGEEQDKIRQEAVNVSRAALAAAPNVVELRLPLYQRLRDAKQLKEGVTHLHEAIKMDPENVPVYDELAGHYDDAGHAESARRILECRLEIEDSIGVRLKRAVTMPPIPKTSDEIERYRTRMGEELDHIVEEAVENGWTIENPLFAPNRTCFYLAYHALNNLELQRKYVRALGALHKPLLNIAPHCRKLPDGSWGSTEPPGGKIRICFISRHFRTHTIAKLNVRLIELFPKEQFEITVAAIGPQKDNDYYKRFAAAADDVIALPTNIKVCQERIALKKFDIIYYPDIGMDTTSYYLSFSRLAPLQVYTWGHPDSTAIRNLDYFLSSKNLESDDADNHYAEKLVRLNRVNTCYERPDGPELWKSRAEMELPLEGNLYGVPQTYFKFHPDVDWVYAKIIEKDPTGWIVVIQPPFIDWQDQLLERWKANYPHLAERLWTMPGLKRHDFFNLCKLCDVMIDPPHFGGGNSSLEAFAFGVPIVTWPGEFLRGRITAALYADVGITSMTADRLQDLPDLAVRTATDREFRETVVSEILSKGYEWFDNPDIVKETSDWLLAHAPPRGV